MIEVIVTWRLELSFQGNYFATLFPCKLFQRNYYKKFVLRDREREREREREIFPFIKNFETRLIRGRKLIRATQGNFLQILEKLLENQIFYDDDLFIRSSQFYNCKYKEKTSNHYSVSYDSG